MTLRLPVRRDVAGPVAVALAGVAVMAVAASMPQGLIPDPVGVGGAGLAAGAGLSALGVALAIRDLRRDPAEPDPVDDPEFDADARSWRAAVVFAAGLGWAVLLPVLGFLVSTMIVAVAMCAVQRVAVGRLLAVGIAAPLIGFVVFNRFFGVRFPLAPLDLLVAGLIPQFRV